MTPILFPGQQADEKICMVLRPHWLVLVSKILIWALFVAILMFTDWATSAYLPDLKAAYQSYFDLFKSVYMMFLILGLFIIWVMYYLDIQIITNERVVDITQNSLLNRTVAELHLSRIEDVTSEVTGLFATFLDFGNVYIQTAGTVGRFKFDRVPNPARVEKMVLDLYEQLPENLKENKTAMQK